MRRAVENLLDRHPIIWYTIARLAVFGAVLVPLALVGLRGVALLGIAILISGAISLFALDGIRARYSGSVSGYFTRLNRRIDDATRAEDEELDRLEAQRKDQAQLQGQAQQQGQLQGEAPQSPYAPAAQQSQDAAAAQQPSTGQSQPQA